MRTSSSSWSGARAVTWCERALCCGSQNRMHPAARQDPLGVAMVPKNGSTTEPARSWMRENMAIFDRLDPELAVVVAQVPVVDLSDVPAARAALAELYALINTAEPNPRVSHSDHQAPGRDGNPDVKVRVFRPADVPASAELLPCVYWTQGGGYVLTAPDLDDQWCEGLVDAHRCVVVSVDWRRAPEHPFPAAAEDCYAGLAWVVDSSRDLGVDARRIAIAGHSSGGGSTAGLALLVRDRAEFSVAHAMLIYPMIDDTDTTRSSQTVTDPQVWNRTNNEIGWRSYLGDTYGTDSVSPYAAPARMTELGGLPPTSILTGDLDLFVDEDVTYAQRLMHAEVPTELHVYPGAHHGFDRQVPTAAVSRQVFADRDAILARVFNPPSAHEAGSPTPVGVTGVAGDAG
ncbi:MAG: alpha/beta hydrolase [Janthinobacterium lividum]